MPHALFIFFKKTILSCLCLLSLGGIVTGVFLTVTKSPAEQAKTYMQLSKAYVNQSDFSNAKDMAYLALSYQPYNEALWQNLKSIKQQQHKTVAKVNVQEYKSFAALKPNAPQ